MGIKISELNELVEVQNDDIIPVVDIANAATKKTYVKNLLKNKIVTGEECATNEFIDGKRVYRKRIDCGILPNATNKDIDTGLDFINSCTLIRMSGMAKYSSGLALPLPFVSVANLTNNIQININTENKLSIITGNNRSEATAYVDLHYTKNSE